MKIALIIVSIVLVLSLVANYLMLRAAIKYTNKHNKTTMQVRKAKAKIVELQKDVYKMRQLLDDAENAQKGTEI